MINSEPACGRQAVSKPREPLKTNKYKHMKKVVLAVSLFISLIGFSQENQEDRQNPIQQNEVKINALFLVIGAFEGTYERLLNEESGVGISVFLPFDDDIDLKYYVSPYYRMYFGKKYASGFFVEGFGMLNSYNNNTLIFNDQFDLIITEQKNVTDFALGISVGGKWVTKRGMFAELNFGVGRNLFNSNNDNDFDEFVGKAAISIGYRF